MNMALGCRVAMDFRLTRSVVRASDQYKLTVRDLHLAPRETPVGIATSDGIAITLVRTQWSKDRSEFVLHANPSSWSTAGFQWTDFLKCLGFSRYDHCSFYGKCYVRTVSETFSLDGLSSELRAAYEQMVRAESILNRCGVSLPQEEGIGYFYGQPSVATERQNRLSGNGHNVMKRTEIKRSDDHAIEYCLTFVRDRTERGFVTHYRVKPGKRQREYNNVLRFLGFDKREECPEFDFESCCYITLKTGTANNYYTIEGDTVHFHQLSHFMFDALKDHFASGVDLVISANRSLHGFGLSLWSDGLILDEQDSPSRNSRADHQRGDTASIKRQSVTTGSQQFEYDVALSFAGSDRKYAQDLNNALVKRDIAVFYDKAYEASLWGKDLAQTLPDVFNKRARYCVVFVSREYRDRVWTMHEFSSALARAVNEKGSEYILPIRIDDTELDGLSSSISYLSIEIGVDRIAEILIEKLEP